MLKSRRISAPPWVLLSALLATGCPVDSRVLELRASSSLGGGANVGGEGGTPSELGSAGEAGAIDTPGSSGSGQGGTTSAAAGGPTQNGGSSAGGSDGGTGGSVLPLGSCPDLDQNSVPDCQESLVQDPSFDSDGGDGSMAIAAWANEANATKAWQDTDADARTKSGSLAVKNINVVSIDGLTMAGAKQCVKVTGGTTYELYAKTFVSSGQAGAPAGGFNINFFAAADCSGDVLTGKTSNLPDATDSWSVLHAEAQAFSNARSMLVRLVAVKEFKVDPVTVLFDDVLVKAKSD